MSRVIALIPARVGSKGVPDKNWRQLAGKSCVVRATEAARSVGAEVVVSSDREYITAEDGLSGPLLWLWAQAPLHTDDCPMIDIVKDALARVPGEPDDIWVLLQPSSPLRRPVQVKQAVDVLRGAGLDADSVVSISPSASIDMLVSMDRDGMLLAARESEIGSELLGAMAVRRQDCSPSYLRDGNVYAFWRRTVDRYGNIYGFCARGLATPPDDSLSIDTPADWAEAERRLQVREDPIRKINRDVWDSYPHTCVACGYTDKVLPLIHETIGE